MKDLMKAPFALAGKSCFLSKNICKILRKRLEQAEIIFFFKNLPTFNFMNGDH